MAGGVSKTSECDAKALSSKPRPLSDIIFKFLYILQATGQCDTLVDLVHPGCLFGGPCICKRFIQLSVGTTHLRPNVVRILTSFYLMTLICLELNRKLLGQGEPMETIHSHSLTHVEVDSEILRSGYPQRGQNPQSFDHKAIRKTTRERSSVSTTNLEQLLVYTCTQLITCKQIIFFKKIPFSSNV